MSSKNEILANFQILTTIDDVEEAILQLEESNWNLIDAVNKAEPSAPKMPPLAVPGVLGAHTSRSHHFVLDLNTRRVHSNISLGRLTCFAD